MTGFKVIITIAADCRNLFPQSSYSMSYPISDDIKQIVDNIVMKGFDYESKQYPLDSTLVRVPPRAIARIETRKV